MATVREETPITRELTIVRNRLRRFFEEPFALDLNLPFWDEKRMERLSWSPAVEAAETPTEYLITAELPGIAPENVEVAMAEGMLTLRGTKEEERKAEGEKRAHHMWEREYGSFERTFRFPLDVDPEKVAAEFASGVLTVKVPKVELAAPVVRTVPITKK